MQHPQKLLALSADSCIIDMLGLRKKVMQELMGFLAIWAILHLYVAVSIR